MSIIHYTLFLYTPSDRLVLITPEKHPLAKRSSIKLGDAVTCDFIGLQQDTSLQELLSTAAKDAGERLHVRIQVRSFESICRMIGFGMGVGVLPEEAVTSHIHSFGLCIIPLDEAWAERELKLGIRDYDALSILARQMVDHLIGESSA